jgi:hypothetical protein
MHVTALCPDFPILYFETFPEAFEMRLKLQQAGNVPGHTLTLRKCLRTAGGVKSA